MSKSFTAQLLHANPEVIVLNGPKAEAIARKLGILKPLRKWVESLVAKTGSSQRAVTTYVHGQDLIGAVYWGGFDDPKDNGIICCIGHCTKPEDMPIVLSKLAEFFSFAINQYPCPWATN